MDGQVRTGTDGWADRWTGGRTGTDGCTDGYGRVDGRVRTGGLREWPGPGPCPGPVTTHSFVKDYFNHAVISNDTKPIRFTRPRDFRHKMTQGEM